MTEIPIKHFSAASGLFKEQVRGEFGRRIVADILEPMAGELEALASETENTRKEINDLMNQLNEKD